LLRLFLADFLGPNWLDNFTSEIAIKLAFTIYLSHDNYIITLSIKSILSQHFYIYSLLNMFFVSSN
jgi:hypothetical protein